MHLLLLFLLLLLVFNDSIFVVLLYAVYDTSWLRLFCLLMKEIYTSTSSSSSWTTFFHCLFGNLVSNFALHTFSRSLSFFHFGMFVSNNDFLIFIGIRSIGSSF